MNSSQQHKLALAWKLRLGQCLEESLLLKLELQAELGISNLILRNSDFFKLGQQDPESTLALSLLHGSHLRAQRHFTESRELLHACRKFAQERALGQNFWLNFETALTAYLDGNYLQMLESNLLAYQNAPDDIFGLVASANIAFSCDSLGHDPQAWMTKAKTARAALSEKYTAKEKAELKANDKIVAALDKQLRVLEIKNYFGQGQFAKLESEATDEMASKSALGTPHSQVHFELSAYLSFPYLSFSEELEELANKSLQTSLLPGQFQYHYRLRTLMGQSHPMDEANARVSDRIDRIYQWTWRWLNEEEAYPTEKLLREIASLLKIPHFESQMTAEDAWLLHNALCWHTLFEKEGRGLNSILEARLAPKSSDRYAVFTLEHAFMSVLKAELEDQKFLEKEYRESLKSHPLYSLPSLKFSAWLEEREQSMPKRLAKAFRRQDSAQCLIVVDGNRNAISRCDDGSSLESSSATKALFGLRDKTSMSIPALLRVAFGVLRYDPTLHYPKVQNLLLRLRKFFTHLEYEFRLKDGFIVNNVDWTKFCFVGSMLDEGSFVLQNHLERWLNHEHEGESVAQRPLRETGLPQSLSRKTVWRAPEIQKELKLSKATTHRRISEWLGRGYLESQGSARATRYKIKAAFKRKLLEGENL